MYTLTEAGALSALKRTLVLKTDGVNVAAAITVNINTNVDIK